MVHLYTACDILISLY